MKLENIKVAARLRESPAALFKVNKISLSEDEKSIVISNLNVGLIQNSILFHHEYGFNYLHRGDFDCCFGKFSQYSEVVKGTECSKYLKQMLHGYNSCILSCGVGESDVPGSRSDFLIENLETLQKLMDQNSYRFDYSLAFTVFGISDGHCVNLQNYKKCDSLEIAAFLQDYEMMEEIKDLEEIKQFISKGYSLPILVFVMLRTEPKNLPEKCAANVSILCLGDLGSLSNPSMEKSITNLKSLIFTMDQKFVSGELRIRESPLTHLLSPFLGGNAQTQILMEILTNSSFNAVSDAFLMSEALRKVKNRVEQVFENYLVEEVDGLWEENQKLALEKTVKEKELKELNSSLSRLLCDQASIKDERDLLSVDNETQKFLLDYNLARMEVEKLKVKDKIRSLRIEMVQLDHQKSLKNSQAFYESLGRKRAEFELKRAIRAVRETELSYGQQIGGLKARIMQASDELQRSIEERSIMQSKLQNAQHRIEMMTGQLKDVEISRAQIDRHNSSDSKLERIKTELEAEIRQMRRELEKARESERQLSKTVSRAEGQGGKSQREIMELERELRLLKSENSLLQSKLSTKETLNSMTKLNTAKPSKSQNSQSSAIGLTGTPMIPSISIPVIRVPSALKLKEKEIPLEVLDDSPIVRRGKRLSNAKEKASPIKKVNVETENSVPISNTLTSLLDGVGKKKIKLPERIKPSTSAALLNSNSNSLPPPSTPSEIPRSTPISSKNEVDPSVMQSIISNFTVKLPAIKK